MYKDPDCTSCCKGLHLPSHDPGPQACMGILFPSAAPQLSKQQVLQCWHVSLCLCRQSSVTLSNATLAVWRVSVGRAMGKVRTRPGQSLEARAVGQVRTGHVGYVYQAVVCILWRIMWANLQFRCMHAACAGLCTLLLPALYTHSSHCCLPALPLTAPFLHSSHTRPALHLHLTHTQFDLFVCRRADSRTLCQTFLYAATSEGHCRCVLCCQCLFTHNSTPLPLSNR